MDSKRTERKNGQEIPNKSKRKDRRDGGSSLHLPKIRRWSSTENIPINTGW
jgi:hypothetical protein